MSARRFVPAQEARLRNTVRIYIGEDATDEARDCFGRNWVVVKILKELCNFPVDSIFCLQDFPSAGFVDLTFVSPLKCSTFFEICSSNRDHPAIQFLRIIPLFRQVKVPLVVHMYNPWVAEQDVKTFLSRYCSYVSEGEALRDKYGIWSGKRKYRVTFKEDKDTGAISYPPGSFAIGPHRGFLHFPGQSEYCRRCGAFSHTKERCPGPVCTLCHKEGHTNVNCRENKRCSLCESKDHLYRECPQKAVVRSDAAQMSNQEEQQRETDKQEKTASHEGQQIDSGLQHIMDLVADTDSNLSWAERVETSKRSHPVLDSDYSDLGLGFLEEREMYVDALEVNEKVETEGKYTTAPDIKNKQEFPAISELSSIQPKRKAKNRERRSGEDEEDGRESKYSKGGGLWWRPQTISKDAKKEVERTEDSLKYEVESVQRVETMDDVGEMTETPENLILECVEHGTQGKNSEGEGTNYEVDVNARHFAD